MFTMDGLQGKRICVAVSGGVDSVSLLHYTAAEGARLGFSVCAVNCEHGIRGNASLQDTEFVKTLCAAWEIPVYCFSENCVLRAEREKVSLETAARNFRYEAFESLLKDGVCDFVALAHHERDQAETVLFRLARGTSLTGASAMREVSGAYLRPFLKWSKEKIYDYAKERGLSWREDETNGLPCASRNAIRLNVLPNLEKAVSGATGNLAAFADVAAEDDEFLYRLSQELVEKVAPNTPSDTGIRLKFSKEKPLFLRAVLTVLKGLGVERDYTRAHLLSVYTLQNLETGAAVDLPCGLCAKREYDKIVFYRNLDVEVAKDWEIPFAEILKKGGFDGDRYAFTVGYTPIDTDVDGLKTLRLDLEKIPLDATMRLKRIGDKFRKFGGGEKPLKEYFIDKKIPAWQREYLPVLAVGNKILAVFGVEIADEVKITDKTEKTVFVGVKNK